MIMNRFTAPAAAGALATLLILGGADPATANPAAATPGAAEMRQRAVSYGDLDLTDPRGVRTLRSQVKRAVAGICGPISLVQPVGVFHARRACVEGAWADAKPKVEAAVRVARERDSGPLLASAAR